MKLIHKINIQYFVFSLIIMMVFTVAIYYSFSYILSEELDEKLLTTCNWVQQYIEGENQLPSFEPFILIDEIETHSEHRLFSDTTLTIDFENEPEEFRQLETIKKINNFTYRIIIRESKLESDELLGNIAGLASLALLVLAGSLFIINYLINRSVWIPFYKNLNLVRQFSLQELSPITLISTRISEFENLNEVIKVLIEKVISDYNTLKQFSEDASHELQTPLSIIRAKLESLIDTNNLTESQSEIIQSIYSSVERLSKLNKSLVLLTKVENRQFTDRQEIKLKESIQNRLAEFQELINLKKLILKTSFVDGFRINMSPSLADILINNLLSNAINHNSYGGMIEIRLIKKEFIICNSGEKQFENQEKIFERFYKVNQSSKSIGLGLAIVKKVCDTHNIKVSYAFSENKHCFSLKF